ncbi:hypothetical protein [Vallicoccus soli]|uniref:Uncharacterized protein n=1 Tax=Vallicoccus soli TaxID=2339232 RepID=A0A3A3YZD3_9ACTN|nr:hypothetical protein [Vallicoccus soli]RJK95429.1 hypothetical protein D5H78_12300 [Vallicoccus soli]
MDVETPLWVTLLVAAVGVVATLLAALLSSALTARREAARAREEVAREQARARELAESATATSREVLEREDARRREADRAAAAARAADERRAAYAAFLTAASRWARYGEQKRDQRAARSGGVVPVDATGLEDEVGAALAAVQVLGAPEVQAPARTAYDALVVLLMNLEASHFSVNRVDEGIEQAVAALDAYLAAVRRDLGVDARPGGSTAA